MLNTKTDTLPNYLLIFKVYIALSVFFLVFLDFSNMEIGDRFKGFTGSPTTYSAFLVIIYLLIDTNLKAVNLKRIILFLIVFVFVYLSKTRLLILFMLIYPVLTFIINKKGLRYSTVYLVFFLILFFMYPIYSLVIDYFPELITLRYEDGRDASFGLRNYLYLEIEAEFYRGNYLELFFGKGNEYSRLYIEKIMEQDIYPHNDFLRILNDWGLFGSIVFFIYLYRISKKNITTLMISLSYLILFYSNMIFNLFIISILILTSFQNTQKPQLETKNAN